MNTPQILLIIFLHLHRKLPASSAWRHEAVSLSNIIEFLFPPESLIICQYFLRLFCGPRTKSTSFFPFKTQRRIPTIRELCLASVAHSLFKWPAWDIISFSQCYLLPPITLFSFSPTPSKSVIFHSQLGDPTVPGVFSLAPWPSSSTSAKGRMAHSALLCIA